MTNVHGRKVSGGSFPAELFAAIMRPLVDGVDVGTFTEIKEYPGELLGASRRGGSGDSSGDTPAVTKPRRKKSPKTQVTQDNTADDTEAPRVPAAGAIEPTADTRNPVEVVPQPEPQPDPQPQPVPAPQPDPAPAPPPVEVVVLPPAA